MSKKRISLSHFETYNAFSEALYPMSDHQLAGLLEDRVKDMICFDPMFPLLMQAANRLRRADKGSMPGPGE